MIKNVIFDFGGVLLDLDYQKTENGFRALGVQNFAERYSQLKQSDLFDRLEIGTLGEDEFLYEMHKVCPAGTSDIQILSAWNAMLLGFPDDKEKMLREIRKYARIFLLSNTNFIHMKVFSQTIEQKCGWNEFRNLFEKAYFSSEIKMRKPDLKTFEFVLRENNLTPTETLFLDDSIQHIEGALKAGIIAEFVTTNNPPSEILKKYFPDFKLP